MGGRGKWRPVEKGLTPGAESEAMQRFLRGDYITTK